MKLVSSTTYDITSRTIKQKGQVGINHVCGEKRDKALWGGQFLHHATPVFSDTLLLCGTESEGEVDANVFETQAIPIRSVVDLFATLRRFLWYNTNQ